MQYPALWFVVLTLAVVLVIAVLSKRRRSKWGFVDVVKNPRYWDDSNKMRQEVAEAVEAARSWDEAKIISVTKHFIFDVPTTQDAWVKLRFCTASATGHTRP